MIELETLNNILNKKYYKEYNKDCIHYNRMLYFKKALKKQNIRQFTLQEVIQLLKKSEYYNYFVENMNNINKNLIYLSEGHGIKHNERVALFAFTIAILSKLKREDIRILLEAAKYHDIGRVNDEEDVLHGYKSTVVLENFITDMRKEDKDILKVVCICHSMSDNNFMKIAKKYKIKDKKRCKKLVDILKDSDALDRVRLESESLDIKYLRNKYSKRLVMAAYDLFNNY